MLLLYKIFTVLESVHSRPISQSATRHSSCLCGPETIRFSAYGRTIIERIMSALLELTAETNEFRCFCLVTDFTPENVKSAPPVGVLIVSLKTKLGHGIPR
jgi:hypothetical protein